MLSHRFSARYLCKESVHRYCASHDHHSTHWTRYLGLLREPLGAAPGGRGRQGPGSPAPLAHRHPAAPQRPPHGDRPGGTPGHQLGRHELPPAPPGDRRARRGHRHRQGQGADLARRRRAALVDPERAGRRRGRPHRSQLAGARLHPPLRRQGRAVARRAAGLAGGVGRPSRHQRQRRPGDPGPAAGHAGGDRGRPAQVPPGRPGQPAGQAGGGLHLRLPGRPRPVTARRPLVSAILSPAAARRVFLTLTVTRWFPVGLVVGILTLWPLERGLTIPEALSAMSLTGITVFLLELPTSGFADAFGRKPVYVTAAVLLITSAVVFYTATAWWQFALAAVLTGLLYLGLGVGHLTAVLVILKEPDRRGAGDSVGMRRAAASVREAPVVVRGGLSLLRHNRVLGGLVAVELFWSAGMVVFETFQPIRLAELLGSEEAAAAVMGPVASAGWGLFALGSALAAVGSRRLGVARTAILARILNGLGAVVMGLVAGPVALIAAYAFTY